MKDSFIGSTFTTPSGGVLNVVGKLPKIKGKIVKYTVECSLCSEDKELFPETFSVVKGSLAAGSVPCGCATNYRWSKEQNIIRIKRECDKREYKFLGFYGKYKGLSTKLKLYNPVTNNNWHTTSINNLLRGRGDPMQKGINIKSARTLPDDIHRTDFINAGFHTEDKFTRNATKKTKQGKYPYWDFECHICSNDKYVKAGLCSGIFTSSVNNLKAGKKPCRCSEYYRWTKKQREYQIKNICEEEGLTFLGWCNTFINCKEARFNWVCKEGHLCENTAVDGFINNGNRCKTCRNLQGEGNGYYPERAGEQDFLYVMDVISRSIKVGRSFNVEDRRRGVKSSGKLAVKPKVLQVYTATHEVVYNTEQMILTELRAKGLQYPCNWTNECFYEGCLTHLQHLLDKWVSCGVLNKL